MAAETLERRSTGRALGAAAPAWHSSSNASRASREVPPQWRPARRLHRGTRLPLRRCGSCSGGLLRPPTPTRGRRWLPAPTCDAMSLRRRQRLPGRRRRARPAPGAASGRRGRARARGLLSSCCDDCGIGWLYTLRSGRSRRPRLHRRCTHDCGGATQPRCLVRSGCRRVSPASHCARGLRAPARSPGVPCVLALLLIGRRGGRDHGVRAVARHLQPRPQAAIWLAHASAVARLRGRVR